MLRVDVSTVSTVGVCGKCSWRTIAATPQEVWARGYRHAREIHGPTAGNTVRSLKNYYRRSRG
jgi:predicted small metal-binding protein